jgi:hypothetical protein
MGSARWDSDSYAAFSSTVSTKHVDEIYKSRTIVDKATAYSKTGLSPKGVGIRESRDSVANPQSNAIIVGLDVTGSMGMIADVMAKKGLGVLFDQILHRKPVVDPHIMFMGIGDVNYDNAPLQVSQFEADDKIIAQLTDLYLEHGGGGNNYESYNLPWYFAALHTSIDCFEKRQKKGYLFTIGDEQAPAPLTQEQIELVTGDKAEKLLTNAELLTMVGRMYNVYHIMVGEGDYARSHAGLVRKSWTETLGQRALWLDDHTKLAEVIVSAIQINEGSDPDMVAKSWDGSTELVVRNATSGLTAAGKASGGVTRL